MIWATRLAEVHADFAWVVVSTNAIAGIGALTAHWYPPLRRRALWVFTAVAELTIAVQVVLGVVLQNREDIEPPRLHSFYGFVALVAVGLIYSYRPHLDEYRYLLYGFGGLFLMGLAARAMILDG